MFHSGHDLIFKVQFASEWQTSGFFLFLATRDKGLATDGRKAAANQSRPFRLPVSTND